MSRTTFVAVAVALLAGSAGVANAGTVEMRYTGVGQARVVTVAGMASGSVYAGELVHEFRNGTGDAAGLDGLIRTFCTEVTQHVSGSWGLFNLVSADNAPSPGAGMGEVKATQLALLYDVASGQQHLSSDYAAAFQMMVWEIVYDFDPTVVGTENLSRTAGNMRFTGGDSHFGDVSAIFETLRTSLLASNGVPSTQIAAVVNGGSQDQLVMIPLPSAGLMGMAGLAGIVGVRRRRIAR